MRFNVELYLFYRRIYVLRNFKWESLCMFWKIFYLFLIFGVRKFVWKELFIYMCVSVVFVFVCF